MAKYSRTVEIQGKNSSQIYEKVVEAVNRWREKGSFGNLEVKTDDAAKKVFLKAKLFDGSFTVTEGKAIVDLNLSFLASPFRGKIDEQIDAWVSRSFS